jgi:hypothetical protein
MGFAPSDHHFLQEMIAGRRCDMIVIFGSINVDLIVPVPRLPRPGETVLGGDHALPRREGRQSGVGRPPCRG